MTENGCWTTAAVCKSEQMTLPVGDLQFRLPSSPELAGLKSRLETLSPGSSDGTDTSRESRRSQPGVDEPLGADLQHEALLNYFRVIHDKHHSLFHQPTFDKDQSNGLVPEAAVSAMIALGAR